jgi:hypothetical protein
MKSMNNMKSILVPMFALCAGLVVGVGGMVLVIQKGPTQVIVQQANVMVELNVVYATLLHDQKYAELNRLLKTNLDASFNYMEALGLSDGNQSSAKLVRGYYDLTGLQPDRRIDPYLSGVKGSDVRRLASAMTDFSDQSPAR